MANGRARTATPTPRKSSLDQEQLAALTVDVIDLVRAYVEALREAAATLHSVELLRSSKRPLAQIRHATDDIAARCAALARRDAGLRQRLRQVTNRTKAVQRQTRAVNGRRRRSKAADRGRRASE